jgi:DNA-binding protein H-NS
MRQLPKSRLHSFGYEKISGRARRHRPGSFKMLKSAGAYAEKNVHRFQANSHENEMRKRDLEAMQFDELWQVHEELTKKLSDRIVAEKRELEGRLAKLNRVEVITEAGSADLSSRTDRAPRRKYPKVLPKYRNPLIPSETWSGRGKQPRWLVAALKTGHKLEEFKIRNPEKAARKKGFGQHTSR